MIGDPIPDENHIARFCQPKHISDGVIQPSAFLLRENIDKYLSVNCLEYLNVNNKKRIEKLKDIYKINFRNQVNVGKIAVLHIKSMCKYVKENSEDNRCLTVLHESDNLHNNSHCGIHNLKYNDDLIAALIWNKIKKIYSANKN